MNFRASLNSIVTRLVITGVMILLFSSIIRGFMLTYSLRQNFTELISTQLVTIANYAAKNVDHNILERREFLERVAMKFPLPLLHNQKELQTWLGERNDLNLLFSSGLLVLDTSGRALVDYPALPDWLDQSFADRDYFQQAMNGEFAIGRPIFGQISKMPLLPMSMPLRDSAGVVQAILVGISALNSPNFLEALYTIRVGNTGEIVLVLPRDQLSIGSSEERYITFQPTLKEGVHPQHDQAMKGFRGAGISVNRAGLEELAAIASVPSSGWFIVARLPISEVLASITPMQYLFVKTTFFIAPVFTLIVIIGLRYQLRPLMNAAQLADRMTLGEIVLEPLPILRDDEVGHLTRAFNRLLSKLLKSRAALQHSAHHDLLTGLPNHQLLADRMQQAHAHAQRTQRHIALLFLDLDGFKPINDRLGHGAGDAALCEVAARLSKALRREDTLARVGGDEFVILLSDLNDQARAVAELVANKCLGAFQAPFILDGESCRLGTSIGIAIGHGEYSLDQLMIAADEAMYRAKASGRGRFCWAND
ncbi:MAG: diguanylate cyclase [Candidatus Contendobacter sp.]|nr:diguanylate cyclase [Candidatus Contendobacter sp.]